MSRRINVGGVPVGGGAPVAIQSMCSRDAHDREAVISQINELAQAGCEIVRVAVPDMEAAKALREIRAESPIPIVADIHFDYRLALEAVEAGADKIRINPGNIGGEGRLQAVADCCRAHGVPIRVGVNSGSLEKRILEKYGGVTAEGMVESALDHVAMLEKCSFHDVCVSLKSSSVPLSFAANRLFAEKSDCPLHIGVTESGFGLHATVKSAVGIGALLLMGTGDTIRVSLTDDPVNEVHAAKAILKAAGLRKFGPELISCPTCGRTRIDLITLARRVEERLRGCDKEIVVAVMGCVVNGPGEAASADVGIAGGDGKGVVFCKGKPVRTVAQDELLDALFEEIERI